MDTSPLTLLATEADLVGTAQRLISESPVLAPAAADPRPPFLRTSA